ncbi:MAG: hypothetical protein JWR90_1248 [Marmoricola sp.]|nr:hypothetical protein [Marmoricola sp.]
MSAPEQALRLRAGVELGYALVDRLARDLGIRVLAMKGPVLQLQGLRGPHVSADVDALVDPEDLARTVAALEELGWVAGGPYFWPLSMPHHSVTMHHPQWPCEIDLHHYFPGFLAPAQEVFELLWDRRASVVLAGRDVTCVDRIAHAAVAGLHYLRHETDPRSVANLHGLTDHVLGTWSAADLAVLSELAVATGSSITLAPLLTGVGAPAGAAGDAARQVGLEGWRLRTRPHSSTVVWLIALRRTPWRRRPLFLLHAVFPPFVTPDLRRTRRGRRAQVVDRLRRLGRAARALPALPRDLRELRRLIGGRR